jgi:hypothetical protein
MATLFKSQFINPGYRMMVLLTQSVIDRETAPISPQSVIDGERPISLATQNATCSTLFNYESMSPLP